MPLTRHLYELDEVVSALQTCLRNWYNRAVFWTWELVVSGEEALALDTIRDAWLLWSGGRDPTVVSFQPRTPEDWIRLVLRVIEASKATGTYHADRLLRAAAATTERKHIAYPPKAGRAAVRRRERATAFVASLDPAESIDHGEAALWWISLDSACRSGYTQDALWLLQAVQPVLSSDAIWSALCKASRGGPPTATAISTLQGAASPHPIKQILHQAAAILLLCCPTATRIETMIAPPAPTGVGHFVRDWAAWDTVIGRRAARIQSIPAEALHAGTTRGSLDPKYTNIPDLRDPVPLLLESCRWWRETVIAAGAVENKEADTVCFPDDDVYEDFMDTHFPDDIPDEWSAADQQKSHGRGCATTKTQPAPVSIPIREEILEHRDWVQGIAISRGRRQRLKSVSGALTRRSQ